MNLVNKIERGIIKIKKERDEWIKQYQDIVNTFKGSIDDNTKKIDFLNREVESLKNKDKNFYRENDEIKKLLKKYIVQHSKKLESQNYQISKIVEQLKYIESKQYTFENYKNSIEDKSKKLDVALKEFENFDSKMKSFYDKLIEIEKYLGEYSRQTNKKIDGIEKKLGEIKEKANHNYEKISRHDSVIFDIKSKISEINEKMKMLEEKLEKHDRLFNEINTSVKEFKNYVINFINSLTKEYEKRFDKFKSKYDEVIAISDNLKMETRKTNNMYSDFEKSMKKISLIENKLEKLESNLNMIDRRMDVFKKERQIIVDKFYSLKDNLNKQLKEIEDALMLLTTDINKMKIKQAKLESS